MANRLINAQSPYLLQHAHNPVDWYSWSDEAFARAKAEHKPVLVSIGYAACHWCHVMERESFEDAQVAAYMNEHFICVKVDREEHPDVDHLYMDAVQAISGSGGWPLNAFVTPDRIPFYGGTYFPPRPAFNRPSWVQVLQRMHEIWSQQHDEVKAQAKQMVQYLRNASKVGTTGKGDSWNIDTCRKMADTLLQQADKEKGGFGGAPKFPGTMAISFLLEQYHFTGNEAAKQQALLSLDAMIDGGIYDQLGGGFARYATDANWLIPHFEKMLYDNALLIWSLCDAYSITKEERYNRIIEETIAFAERELKDASGLYYSALDADSEGVEGKFYTWTDDEWLKALGENDEVVARYFGITEEGNWEGTNILHVAESIADVAQAMGIAESEVQQRIDAAKEKLFAYRGQRIRPLTDDKSLLSWNALMNTALSRAGVALQNETYLQRAASHMQLMLQYYVKDGALLHTWKQRIARISANLDDYAYLIQALLQLASATGNNAWILQADKLIEDVLQHFAHEDKTFFYYTADTQTDIPVRKVDVYDGATPSANAIMAQNLLLAGLCMERTAYTEQAGYMLQHIIGTTLRYPYSFGYWAILLQRHVTTVKTVASIGPDALSLHRVLQKHYAPQCYFITSEKEISVPPVFAGKLEGDKSLIYVCTDDACLAPVADVASALPLLGK